MIGSLLIANRGEIAVRIMRTARRLGIRTIAVYSDADRDACHVAAADEAIRIGPAPARESYLRADAIMEAAARSGAEAVHPGYGFLSEKPELAELCAASGHVFVGPSADRIVAMGAKIGAKRIAARAGVACVPGYEGDDQSDARLCDEAERLGFPVMVKASAGGGGRGMRRVFDSSELNGALDIARREAAAAFGDPALLIEKLVLRPRHLEVQVAGDKHGNLVHLFERDCSVQRNNQKILEEAPAPNLAPSVRAKLLERGVALARAIAYDNLGTIEFILEEGHDEPWFLEMNTRLQVEHPVTEAITGLDLVEWQLRIASGETLPLTQDCIRETGHAIEARITAERADHDFRPDAGRITAYREPGSIRIDSGVGAGSDVTLFYDSLLTKAIAFGSDRETARTRLISGLRDFVIQGPATTLPFLIDSLDDPIFAAGDATTRFIDDAFPAGWTPARAHRRLAESVACVLALHEDKPASSIWSALKGFRLLESAGGYAETRMIVSGETGASTLTLSVLSPGRHRVRRDDGVEELSLRTIGDAIEVEADGHILNGTYSRVAGVVRLMLAGEDYVFTIAPETAASAERSRSGAHSGVVAATMPGVIAAINVAIGERVEAGQAVVVLESMKLFLTLEAKAAGIVTDITCRPGETVAIGKSLLLISSAEG